MSYPNALCHVTLRGNNRTLFHLRTVDEIRASFVKRDELVDGNAWLDPQSLLNHTGENMKEPYTTLDITTPIAGHELGGSA